jgi:SAM-dependent methyltransferase
MIIHKLIGHHLKHQDDAGFYLLQAQDAIQWIQRSGVELNQRTRALDLGCGHGVFGAELVKCGCQVVFADEDNFLIPEVAAAAFEKLNIDQDDLTRLGTYDLVVCSNVFEHLARPAAFLGSMSQLLKPGGMLYLSWTNWLSPWGGHEFSPFQYLGPRWGTSLYDQWVGKRRKHTPYKNLFPTYVGRTLKMIRRRPELRVVKIAPRYYPEFALLMRLPILREFLAWNCALLIGRKNEPSPTAPPQ